MRLFPLPVIGTIQTSVTRGEDTWSRLATEQVPEFRTSTGLPPGGGLTSIGNDNYFMAYSHIAHDCHVEAFVFSSIIPLGGHCLIEDGVFSAGSPRTSSAGWEARLLAGYGRDPTSSFAKVAGMRPVLLYGMNAVGCGGGVWRRGTASTDIQILFSGLNTSQAVEKIAAEVPAGPDRRLWLSSSWMGASPCLIMGRRIE
jgi:UDP-N-acetylglucosamine acyltransferase